MNGRMRVIAALLGISLAGACARHSAFRESGAQGAPVLTVARVKDAVTLDPAQATDGMSLNVTQEIMRGLVEFHSGTFEVEPAIARSWSVSANGRTWTFVLKNGLRFSDGTPVDAQAVKFNFDRWRLLTDPYHGNFPFTYYATMFGGFPGLIQDVEAPSSRVVVFHLARPFAPFLHDLAMPSFAIGSPQAIRNDLEDFGQHPIGWGPYVLEQWVRGDRIVLRANPRYADRPYYKEVVIRDLADQAEGIEQMERGTVGILTDPTPRDAAALAKTPGVTVYEQPANNCAYLAMNMDRQPFGSTAVRRAVAYAIDVRSIVRMYYPMGAEVADNWTPPGMAGENPAVRAYPYDPARARALLAAAGYVHGFSTQLVYATIPRPYMPQPGAVAEAIARELARVGIRVKLVPLDWNTFLATVHNGEHAMALAGWSGDNGDPDNFLYTLLDKDSARRPNALNFSFWRSDRYHALMLAGQETSDPARRALIYEEANAMIHDLVPAIPIVHVAAPVAARTSIGGFIPNPTTFIAFEFLYPAG